MGSMAAFVYFWSSAYEVSGGCATDTLYPSFLRMLATASQPEPSAKAPCTRTTFSICCVMTILLCSKGPLGPLSSMSLTCAPTRFCRFRPKRTLETHATHRRLRPCLISCGILLVLLSITQKFVRSRDCL